MLFITKGKGDFLFDKDIKILLSQLCCSICKKDFDENSLITISEKKGTIICHLVCQNCGKDFGEIVLGINHNSTIHTSLTPIEGGAPISADDVIDAHRFIRDNL